jgi:hypothetical protein
MASPSSIAETTWDCGIAGGSLAGSVVASSIRTFNDNTNIPIVEAGNDARERTDIVWSNFTDLQN